MKSFSTISLLFISFIGLAQETAQKWVLVDQNYTPLMAAMVSLCENDSCNIVGLTDEDGLFIIEDLQNKQNIKVRISFFGTERDYTLANLNDTLVLYYESTLQPVKGNNIISKESSIGKPAIYLYPTQKTTVHIQHDFKGEIGTTYPAYKNGWKVIAEPNGMLLNLADNRKYEYLFWDGTYTFPATHFDYNEGFVVSRENTTDFLWKQLAHIGLNEKEINDFVVYWLPQLERNDHNFIYFHINNDIDQSSVLTVQPKPDSWIRLFMEFKPVPANYSIAEQQLQTIKRNGFTLVEWGGAVIENSATDFE